MMMPSIFGENLFDDFMNDFTDDFAFPAFADAGKEAATDKRAANMAPFNRLVFLSFVIFLYPLMILITEITVI